MTFRRKTTRYFQGIELETKICKAFQKYIERKRPNTKTYLSIRSDKQAPIDFIGRIYHPDSNKTISELAVEVRTLNCTSIEIKDWLWHIMFPISKLNELMQFWRMWKECYIVYKLNDWVFFLSWDYYLKHNFEIWENKKGNYLKLPFQCFIYCN